MNLSTLPFQDTLEDKTIIPMAWRSRDKFLPACCSGDSTVHYSNFALAQWSWTSFLHFSSSLCNRHTGVYWITYLSCVPGHEAFSQRYSHEYMYESEKTQIVTLNAQQRQGGKVQCSWRVLALEGHEASEAQATGKMTGVFGDTKK